MWGICGVGTADEYLVANGMRDFTAIRTKLPYPGKDWPFDVDPETGLLARSRTFQPFDANREHEAALAFLRRSIPADKPVVLLTHHAPSFQSCHGAEYGTTYLDTAYGANLVDIFFAHPNIKFAVHGHTHHREWYQINQTWIVANPRGYYPHERVSKDFDPLSHVFEI